MSIEQERLSALAAYAVTLRKKFKGNTRIGEIADQIELLALGPMMSASPKEEK